GCLASSVVRPRRPQTYSDDHKLGWLDRCDADDADQAAVVDVGLGHRRPVALHEVGLFRFCPFETSVQPHRSQEVGYRAPDARPQRLRVWLKHYVLSPRSIEASMKIRSLRTFTYFQSGSLVMQRPP